MTRPILLLLPLLLLCGCPAEDEVLVIRGPTTNPDTKIVEGLAASQTYVAVGSRVREFYTAFSSEINGTVATFQAVIDRGPRDILMDETGTTYDIYGTGSGGTNDGVQLQALPCGTSFWLTPSGMFPGIELNGFYPGPPNGLILQTSPTYDVPVNSLFTGSGFGIINTIDDPEFEEFNQRRDDQQTYLLAEDEIVAVKINGEERIYPIPVLTAFEIVNDVLGGVPISVAYSPLSNSARVYERPNQGVVLGVTGMLLNSAMIMYDKNRVANRYHQITGACIAGPDRGQTLRPLAYHRTSWRKWRSIALINQVLVSPPSINLANVRRMNARIQNDEPHAFPVDFVDTRRPEKEMVLSIIGRKTGVAIGLETFE